MLPMSLLYPDSVAVIGASADERKVGHMILSNLLTQGYKGGVYPVNPKGGTILGRPVYPTIGDIASPVDLAIIATPAETVIELAEECGKKGVDSLIVISAGFAETGAKGRALEGGRSSVGPLGFPVLHLDPKPLKFLHGAGGCGKVACLLCPFQDGKPYHRAIGRLLAGLLRYVTHKPGSSMVLPHSGCG